MRRAAEDLAERDIPTRPEVFVEPAPRSRKEIWLLAGAAAVVLALGSVAFLTRQRWLAPGPADVPAETTGTAAPSAAPAPATREEPSPIAAPPATAPSGSSEIRRIAFDRSGSLLAWEDPADREIHLVQMGSGRPSSRLRWTGAAPVATAGLAFTPDGLRLVTATVGSAPFVQAWSTGGGEPLWTTSLDQPAAAVTTQSDPARVLVLAGLSVLELDADTGVTRNELRLAAGGAGVPPPTDAVFSPDGRSVAWGQGLVVMIWSPADGGRPLELVQSERVSRVAYRPDGRYLAVAAGPTTYVWEIATGRLLRRLDTGPDVRSLAFRSDGNQLASTTAGGIAVWDVPGSRLVERRDVPGRSTGAAVYQPGTDLLTVGVGAKVKTWRPGS